MLAILGQIGCTNRIAASHGLGFLNIRNPVMLAGLFNRSTCKEESGRILNGVRVVTNFRSDSAGHGAAVAEIYGKRIFSMPREHPGGSNNLPAVHRHAEHVALIDA